MTILEENEMPFDLETAKDAASMSAEEVRERIARPPLTIDGCPVQEGERQLWGGCSGKNGVWDVSRGAWRLQRQLEGLLAEGPVEPQSIIVPPGTKRFVDRAWAEASRRFLVSVKLEFRGPWWCTPLGWLATAWVLREGWRQR